MDRLIELIVSVISVLLSCIGLVAVCFGLYVVFMLAVNAAIVVFDVLGW